MVKRNLYGKTWWGNAWLEALEKLDKTTNRLPKGKKYASDGSIEEISLGKDGSIVAKVHGTRPKPYRVKIALPKLSSEEVKVLKDIIVANPSIASELSLRKLPEALLAILKKENIYLLPQSWDSIDATCTCSDWVNPCEHIAGIYYVLANEVDKDPFLLFNFRGVKTEDLLGAAQWTGRNDKMPQKLSDSGAQTLDIGPLLENIAKDPGELDLNFEKFDIDAIFSLLPETPLLHMQGDFKEILFKVYKNALKALEAIKINEESGLGFSGIDFYLVQRPDGMLFFTPEETQGDLASTLTFIKHIDNAFQGSRRVRMSIPLISDAKLKLTKTTGIVNSIEPIIEMFLSMPLDLTLETTSRSAKFLNAATSVALAIVNAGAFVPEVMLHGQDGFTIRYIHLEHDEKIAGAINYLRAIMPVNFIFRKSEGSILFNNAVAEVISVIITYLIHNYAVTGIKTGNDALTRAFFKGEFYRTKKFEEKQLAKNIVNWLERFEVSRRDVVPVIRISKNGESRFSVFVEIEDRKDPTTDTIPLSQVFASNENVFSQPVDIVRSYVSRQIMLAAEYMPYLKNILASCGKVIPELTLPELAVFIADGVNVLRLLGIRVLIPGELKKLSRPRVALAARLKSTVQKVSYLSMDDLLEFDWQVSIGDAAISPEEFASLLESGSGLFKHGDQYILIDPAEAKSIIAKLNRAIPKLSGMEILHAAITGEIDGIDFRPEKAVRRIISDITSVEDIGIPKDLKAELRPYQLRGFRWLYTNLGKGFGVCLADDMGLGKTVQVIALVLKLKEEGKLQNPVLVICPTTILGNWYKECEKFAPSLKVAIYHGSDRAFERQEMDVVITTYGILRRDLKKFRQRDWSLVVADEAQNIKNPERDQTKAVKAVKAHGYIAMSGTPVENRLMELWSIFDFINKGYLGKLSSFQQKYALTIEKYHDKEQIEKLKVATAPFILRRLKTDKAIISDLPEKILFDEYCYLSKEQAVLYERVVETIMRQLNGSGGMERRGLIFKMITSLKQICNHPVQYAKSGKVSKELSGKAEKTISLLENILNLKEKALIFTQYKEMGELLLQLIKSELKEDALFFHGGVQRAKRDKMVSDFQENSRNKIMVVSLKAGGTGLNLTAATNVIHYDLWWNPAVEAQATDRTYRIGQDKNVMVHRLITLGTFEEKIDEMIKRKKDLADLTITAGEKWIGELSNRELMNIFTLNRE